MPAEDAKTDQFKIVVVVDPEGRRRGVFWRSEIEAYNRGGLRSKYGLPEAIYHAVSLADDLQQPHASHQFLIHHLDDTNVLIFNWDVINGDPSFGADLAARWTKHYRTNLWDWVYNGGVLVIEGQANRSVPVQEAYDAILGEGEVRVSGVEDRLHLDRQEHPKVRRVGTECRATRTFAKSRLADEGPGMPNTYKSAERAFRDYFPDNNSNFQLPREAQSARPTVLWRGWFRGHATRRARFRWVPLLKTSGRGIFNHPTLLATTHGTGAIFIGTMHLALGGEDNHDLLTALVRTSRDPALLPRPGLRVLQVIDRSSAYALGAALLFALMWPAITGDKAPDWLTAVGGPGLLLAVTTLVALRQVITQVLVKLRRT